MLLNQDARDAYEEVTTGWERLAAWLATSASTTAGAARDSMRAAYQAWKADDKGAFSDPAAVDSARASLQAAEEFASQYGYAWKRAGGDNTNPTAIAGTDSQVGTPQSAADCGDRGEYGECLGGKKKPGVMEPVKTGEQPPSFLDDPVENLRRAAVDTAAQAKEEAAYALSCRGLGFPPLFCDWWPWAFGLGAAATLGVILYGTVKAAPIAARVYAPSVMKAIDDQQAAQAMGRAR